MNIKIAHLTFDEHDLVDILLKVAGNMPLAGVPQSDTRPDLDEKDGRAKTKMGKVLKEEPRDTSQQKGIKGLLNPEESRKFMSQIVGKLESNAARKKREDKQHIMRWVQKKMKGEGDTEQVVSQSNQEEKASQQGV